MADFHIEEILYRYIVGGIDDNKSRQRREATERANAIGTHEPERCSCILEGNAINTDITAPGATIALALMYLRTG